ncbi:MAG: Fic family protein [Melioribacteraceae bacterium]|nr:Fic family protein [Melioribacteraceae bacterium]
MEVIEKKYYKAYLERIGNQIETLLNNFNFSQENGDFEYLTKASAVFSSNIEGNSIDLNSFMNYELNKGKFKTGKEIDEIENLITAYNFAQTNSLTEANMVECHKTLAVTLLIESKRGLYRNEPVGVFGKTRLTYLAIEPQYVEAKMNELFVGISELLNSELTEPEVFYFTSLIHLVFVHIHPFSDGNGRVARLLEKWFLAEKLGKDFWRIPSEEYYKNNLQEYYDSINLGVNYYELDYDNSLDFLAMLPNSLSC